MRVRFLLLLLVMPFVAPLLAYEVKPMIYELKPSGQGASSVIKTHNTQAKPITVELVAERRTFDTAGKESRAPADADFVLFPPQAVIPPGVTQSMRVQYVGPPDIAKSVMYTITVKQVAVKLPADTARGLQVLFNFSTVANVVPENAKPKIDVVSIAPQGEMLRLTLRNSGNKYANLTLSSVKLAGAGYESEIPEADWRKALGSGWILPDGTRVIDLPKPKGAPAKELSARLSYVDPTP